jgi:hypothetical protein
MISQREARRLHKRVEELERVLRTQRNNWAGDWIPGWVHIDSLSLAGEDWATVKTARKLGHAVIIVLSTDGRTALIYADKLEVSDGK